MVTLETSRLVIRPFVVEDLSVIAAILDGDLVDADFGSEGAKALAERDTWLRWTVLGYTELARLYQPPYGDRAIALRATGELIGACGYVPCLAPFEQLPGFATEAPGEPVRWSTPEFGLFWAIAPEHQRRGYATEAARAMVEHAFRVLRLKRIVATTTHTNEASIGVMRKLGMRIVRNPFSEPAWLQVVGLLDHPSV